MLSGLCYMALSPLVAWLASWLIHHLLWASHADCCCLPACTFPTLHRSHVCRLRAKHVGQLRAMRLSTRAELQGPALACQGDKGWCLFVHILVGGLRVLVILSILCMVAPPPRSAFEGNVPLMGSAWQGGSGALQHQPFLEHLLCCREREMTPRCKHPALVQERTVCDR